MRTLALQVAYDGAPFCGFARQPQQPTVQGELEYALDLLFHRPVETVCAGRTDSGVHALGQVVSFDITDEEASGLDLGTMQHSLNALTADAIAVRRVCFARSGFSARFDAEAREYRYFFAVDAVPPVFNVDFSWHTGPLDVDAMVEASRCLMGEHDFKSFCRAVSAKDRPTCRELREVSFCEEEHLGEKLVVMKVVGSSFLHSMVRTIAGTLVMVGKGRRPVSWVAEALEACDRTAAGECAPPEGLIFWEVRYGPEERLFSSNVQGCS